ncbi:beta-lactamase/transpeptidase-like protein [Lentinula edodes]|uniref:Beta-lactamase/transpeptidase-like protein n=1 Tax=Lentinula lateritia TaxID=40482 RepID=A0A9W9DCY5_9AGAR|nr:beta-lactamase/transpeptidase-like protein [Lentinula edodes]
MRSTFPPTMHLFTLLITTLTVAIALAEQEQQPLLALDRNTTTTTKNILTPKIDKFIEKTLADWNSAGGVGIAVVQKKEDGSWNVETKGYGIAKVDGSKVSEDTLFSIGSNSKLFDVIATGLLISNESLSSQISWNTKIASIIPEWKLSDPVASTESTIIDLMSHRTGLPRHDIAYHETQSAQSLISKLKYLRPSAEFRDVWQYNNIMYTVLSYIPDVLLHVPFTQYVRKHIFTPLGLNATTYSGSIAEETGNLANGFGRDGVNKSEDVLGAGTTRAMPFWNYYGGEDGNIISGAGGVISSAKDMATWLQVLLLQGKNPVTNEQVIPSSVIEKCSQKGLTKYKSPFPEYAPVVYGGGQMRSSYRGHSFHTQITRFPFSNIGVAVLTNDDAYGAVFMEIIKWRIVDEAFGLEPVDWNSRAKQVVADAYAERIQKLRPRPRNPTMPSVPFASLAGSYLHPAYGTLELCAIPSLNLPISQSTPNCKTLINELSFKLPGTFNMSESVPTFFASMDSAWLSHVRLQHFDGNLFNVSGFQSLPIISSDSARMWESQEQRYWAYDATDNAPITIEFAPNSDVVSSDGVSGFGVTGGFWGAGEGVEAPVGKNAQERAEAWFDRV